MRRIGSKDGKRKPAPGPGPKNVAPNRSAADPVPAVSSQGSGSEEDRLPVSIPKRLYGPAINLIRISIALAAALVILRLGYALIVQIKFPDTGRTPSHFVPFANDLRPEPGTGWTSVNYNTPYSTFFIAPLKGLSCIAIELSTQGGIGKGPSVDWRLERLEPDRTYKSLRSGDISTRVRDTEILDIAFPPVWDSAGKRFRLTLSSPQEGRTALIPMWRSSDRNLLSARQPISSRETCDIAPTASGDTTMFPARHVSGQAGAPFVLDFEAAENRLDGVAILPPQETGDHARRSFVDWSLYDLTGPSPSLHAAGSLNEYDTMAAEEWHILFLPFVPSRGKRFRLALEIHDGQDVSLLQSPAPGTREHSSPRMVAQYFRDATVPDAIPAALAGACYSTPESQP